MWGSPIVPILAKVCNGDHCKKTLPKSDPLALSLIVLAQLIAIRQR